MALRVSSLSGLCQQRVNPPRVYEHFGNQSVRSDIRSHLEFSGALITASSMSHSSHKLVLHHLNNSRSQRVLWLLVRLLIVTYSSSFPLTQKYLSHQGRARGALRDQILPTRLKSTCPKGTSKRQSVGKSPRHHRWGRYPRRERCYHSCITFALRFWT